MASVTIAVCIVAFKAGGTGLPHVLAQPEEIGLTGCGEGGEEKGRRPSTNMVTVF